MPAPVPHLITIRLCALSPVPSRSLPSSLPLSSSSLRSLSHALAGSGIIRQMTLEEPIWFDTPPKDMGSGGAKKKRASGGGGGGGGGRSSQVFVLHLSLWWVDAALVKAAQEVRGKDTAAVRGGREQGGDDAFCVGISLYSKLLVGFCWMIGALGRAFAPPPPALLPQRSVRAVPACNRVTARRQGSCVHLLSRSVSSF